MRLPLLLLTIFITSLMLSGRTIVGITTDESDGSRMSGVSTRLVDGKGKIKRFSATNADGVFKLDVPDIDSLSLQVAMIGYETETLPLDNMLMATDTIRVIMAVKAVKLSEVGVRAKRIRENGDTITYNVGEFKRPQDLSIGETMNRMPGLEVDGGGNVKYQGTEINRLYVDGNDVAGKRQGLVTQNVQAKDVKAVEVLENHQPMQVLRGLSFSDQAAVNLKLKEDRATTTVHGSAGGGYSEYAGGIYTGDLFAMTIKGNTSNLTSLKINNTGTPLGSLSGYWGNDGESLDNYISIGSVGGSGSSLMNRSAALSTSTTWKNKAGGQWRVQADYGYDHMWADRSTVTTYYLPEGDKIISENRHGDQNRHLASVTANYELNQKTYYLNNNFSATGSWDRTAIDITGTLSNSQHANLPSYDITNRLKIIRRFGEKHIVTINSTNQWLYKPQSLSIERDSDTATGMLRYGSDVNQHAFFTDERASYGFIFGKLIMSLEGGVSGFIRHLDSGISGDNPLPDLSTDNDFSTNYFRLFAQPKLEYNMKRINFRLTIPVNYYHYSFGGALDDRNELFLAPNLAVQWKPNTRHTINLNASARRSPASLGNILCGDILSDYRTYNAGIDDYYASTGQSVSAYWKWRLIKYDFFTEANVAQSWNRNKYGTAQTVIGDYVVNSFRAEPSSSESTSANGTISKGISSIYSTFSLGASWRRGTSTIFSQGEPTRRSSSSFSISPRADVKIARWLNADYSFIFSRNNLRLGQMPTNRIDSYQQRLSVTASPRKWIITARASHDRTPSRPGHYVDRVDLASTVRYQLSKKIELSLNANNLLNKRTWVSRSFSDMGVVESVSYQRGRQFLVTILIRQ